MSTEHPKLHRSISNPEQQSHHSPTKVPTLVLNQIKQEIKKLDTKVHDQEQSDQMQNIYNDLDDLFSRINKLNQQVTTERQNKPEIIEFKPQTDRVKPVYVDKRVKKKSFHVDQIPKIITVQPIKGLHIGLFQLGNTLGQGKFGQVIQTIHRETGLIYAIKKLFKSTVHEYAMQDQVLVELEILKKINHPNILKLYGVFTDQYHIFMITQYINGPSLQKMFKNQQKVVSNIIFQVIKALQYLHTNKIAHRDIKPQNILIEDGVVKLVDFGWAVSFANQKPNTFCGTLDYVSPQVVENKNYDGSVDIWSLGILTFQLLSGIVPFKDSLKHVHLNNIVNCEAQKLLFPPIISNDAQDFIRKILKKQPLLRITLYEALRHPFITKYAQANMVYADIANIVKDN